MTPPKPEPVETAEEFAYELDQCNSHSWSGSSFDRKEAAVLIRARDAALVADARAQLKAAEAAGREHLELAAQLLRAGQGQFERGFSGEYGAKFEEWIEAERLRQSGKP